MITPRVRKAEYLVSCRRRQGAQNLLTIIIRKPSSTVAMRTTVSQTLKHVSRSEVFTSSFSSSFSNTMRMHALASASSRGEKTFSASSSFRHVVENRQRKDNHHHHHHRLKRKNDNCNKTFSSSSSSARDDDARKMRVVRGFAS